MHVYIRRRMIFYKRVWIFVKLIANNKLLEGKRELNRDWRDESSGQLLRNSFFTTRTIVMLIDRFGSTYFHWKQTFTLDLFFH